MDTEKKEQIIAECQSMMSKAKYDESKIEQFCHIVSDIIQDTIDHHDEQREFKYKLTKRLDRIEFRVDISGDRIDPLTDGKGADERRLKNEVNSVMFNPETSISVSYTRGWNHIVVKSPSRIANSKLLNEPMVKAMLLGAIAGVVLRFIPKATSSVILDQIAAPIMATVINLLMGIMGPVFFLFIIVSVSSLGSMDNLTKIGKVIIKRFIIITIWIDLLTTAVSFAFFPVFGKGMPQIDLPAIENVLLGTLPKNLISPFVDGNIPQVILLAIVFGTALLMMGESGHSVRDALVKIKEWAMSVMILMMKVLPLIPFISTMMIVANSSVGVFLQGWKYIAAAYICYGVAILIEFIAVSIRCKIGIKDLFKMLKQIILMAFVTATPPVTMQLSYQISEQDMGIDTSFSDLWLPLSNNLFSPSRTISLVLSVFFIAELTGGTVDLAFIVIMMIIVV